MSLDGGAGEIINPDKTFSEVEAESAKGHDLYLTSHQAYNGGERTQRYKANPGNFDENRCYGNILKYLCYIQLYSIFNVSHYAWLHFLTLKLKQ